jgi:hypothetical protein
MLQKVIYETFKISPPSIINGDTPSSKQNESSSRLSRQQTIDRFQNEVGFNVIIMSQLAAGVGLNVVGANHVIHLQDTGIRRKKSKLLTGHIELVRQEMLLFTIQWQCFLTVSKMKLANGKNHLMKF